MNFFIASNTQLTLPCVTRFVLNVFRCKVLWVRQTVITIIATATQLLSQ